MDYMTETKNKIKDAMNATEVLADLLGITIYLDDGFKIYLPHEILRPLGTLMHLLEENIIERRREEMK